jgi:hypothetical protein
MTDDFALLTRVNAEIGVAETDGDVRFLADVIAPYLVFRRASGAVVDRAAYLAAVASSERRDTDIESIQLHGNRAVVACIVTVHGANGKTTRFHNLRLFTRTESGWKLLGWANEPA